MWRHACWFVGILLSAASVCSVFDQKPLTVLAVYYQHNFERYPDVQTDLVLRPLGVPLIDPLTNTYDTSNEVTKSYQASMAKQFGIERFIYNIKSPSQFAQSGECMFNPQFHYRNTNSSQESRLIVHYLRKLRYLCNNVLIIMDGDDPYFNVILSISQKLGFKMICIKECGDIVNMAFLAQNPRDILQLQKTHNNADDIIIYFDMTSTLWHPAHIVYVITKLRLIGKRATLIIPWNDYRNGKVFEPTQEWGLKWLRALRSRKQENNEPRISPACKRFARSCIVVRTYFQHEKGIYSLESHLRSLQNLENPCWDAYIINVDPRPFPMLKSIVSKLLDKRIQVIDIPSRFRLPFSVTHASYPASDWAISNVCSLSRHNRILVTNGDNTYLRTALNDQSRVEDVIILNQYSRHIPLPDYRKTYDQCCIRFNEMTCNRAVPIVGSVDLGGLLLRLDKVIQNDIFFMRFANGTCKGCHDGNLASALRNHYNWSFYLSSKCHFHHNPNPISCMQEGGVYIDKGPWSLCNENVVGSVLSINFKPFFLSSVPCLCK